MSTIKLLAQDRREVYAASSEWRRIFIQIEDRDGSRGPFELQIRSDAPLCELQRRAATFLGVAPSLQQWVIGRVLCDNDAKPLQELAGPDLRSTFHLFLVDFDSHLESTSVSTSTKPNVDNALSTRDHNELGDVYSELIRFDQRGLIPNADAFECQVCTEEFEAGSGVMLRECLHCFCRDCLADLIRHSEEPTISCPGTDCSGTLHEREIRALVSQEEHEKWLARGLAAAESRARDAFHCQTRDCKGWVICEDDVRQFHCPVCKRQNCVQCQTIHEGETCEQHRLKLQHAANEDNTKVFLESLISQGNALRCPGCNVVITKVLGCDWIMCSACKMQICWATRGPRWGPGGRGDTSAGCRCRVNGKKCHPSCGDCH